MREKQKDPEQILRLVRSRSATNKKSLQIFKFCKLFCCRGGQIRTTSITLIRLRTIDKCLQNRGRRWTLEDLIEACSEALYEYEGIDKGVSRRTVQIDIQLMRSDKLGYNAPFTIKEKKYYVYDDPEYTIEKNPLSKADLEKLSELLIY